MLWLARKTGSVGSEGGPSLLLMTVSIMLMFASAFFTDVIGESILLCQPFTAQRALKFLFPLLQVFMPFLAHSSPGWPFPVKGGLPLP